MFDIFSRKYEINQKLHISGKHDYVVERFQEAVTRLKYYFRKTVYTVDNDNLLVQIIRQANVNYVGDDRQFYYAVASRVNHIASALRLNTATHRAGSLGKNHFFGKGVAEFVIATSNGYPDGLDVGVYWQDLQPLKVISHPYSDLTLNLRDGSDTVGVKGYAVLTLDIPLLLLQYVKWRQHAEKYFAQQPTIQQFVYQYPLVNLLPSDLDVTYFNRLQNKALGRENIPQKKRFGLALNDVTNYLDAEQAYLLEMIDRVPVNLINLSQGVPLVFAPTLWDFLQLPNVLFTRTNSPFFLLGYLPYLALLTQLSYQSGSKDNGDNAVFLRREFRQFKGAGWLSNIPGVDGEGVEQFIETRIFKYLP
jgi:hypothetical protein